VALEDVDLDALNRLVKRYSNDVLDTRFVEKLKGWDALYGDADAVRGAVRALADLRDAGGALIRLSDEAAEGAVKFMARAGADLPAEQRELILRRVLTSPVNDAEALLTYIRRSEDPRLTTGVGKLMDASTISCGR
jgi:hypothetical protein